MTIRFSYVAFALYPFIKISNILMKIYGKIVSQISASTSGKAQELHRK
jgi:hypothetical protein